jgi:DNA-binding MarR family transcriptional regulator
MKIKGPKELVAFVELVNTIQSIRDLMKQHLRNKIRQNKFDITVEMMEVLVVLMYNEKLNQQEIAEAVRKNKASLTSLLDNLESRNLIIRQPDRTDRRNNIISLTKQGVAYNKKLLPMVTEFYEQFQKCFAHLDLIKLTHTLQQIHFKILDKTNSSKTNYSNPQSHFC